MDSICESTDLSSNEKPHKLPTSSSPLISNHSKKSKTSHHNFMPSSRHSIERSVPQHDGKFSTGQSLAAPAANQSMCKSAENLYIPSIDNFKEAESVNYDSHDHEDVQKSPANPFKRLPTSSSAILLTASAKSSATQLTQMASSTSIYSEYQAPLPDSYVPYFPSDCKTFTIGHDGNEYPPYENGDPHSGFSSCPRLSPLVNMPHISGESSDEKCDRSECEHIAVHDEITFERSVSFQEQNLDRLDVLRASDSSRSLDSSRILESSQTSQHSSGKERDRKESRDSKSGEKDKKNKKAWYNVLNPTYKSRSEELKKLFRDVPTDERLIVDYSCALQKDILVHGRLYVTPNYFCFYSKIFGWETCLSIKCRDIVSMTKEKTALVIPNALQINTESEKHFLTSFAAREKTYLMLFRIWQNALMDQQMSPTELWQWVHSSYGDELGLTSDDDDYVAPSTEDDMKSTSSVPHALDPGSDFSHGKHLKHTTDSAEDMSQCDPGSDAASSHLPSSLSFQPGSTKTTPKRSLAKSSYASDMGSRPYTPSIGHGKPIIPRAEIPTDFSGSNESDPPVDKIVSTEVVVCPAVSSHHLGREVTNLVVALPLDTVFTLLFTNSTFMLDLYAARKTYDVHASPWQSSSETNQKIRQLTYVVTLPNNSFGPKVSNVTETQVISSFSKPGEIYTVDAEAANSGIPYADSFYVSNHWCLTRASANETRICVWSQVKYKKNVWGFMKSLIDKNAFNGMENLLTDIHTALLLEVDKTGQKKARRRRRRIGSKSCDLSDPLHISLQAGDKSKDIHKSTQIPQRKMTFSALPSVSLDSPTHTSENSTRLSVFILSILLLLNAFLYHRLWALEDKIGKGFSTTSFYIDPNILKLSATGEKPLIEEWVQILHHQEVLHSTEVERWRKAVSEAADYLRKAEESLRNLHSSIPHSQASKLQSLLRHLEVLQQMQSQNGRSQQSPKGTPPLQDENGKTLKQPSKIEL